MSLPSKSREPAVGFSKRRKSFARVVLPDPDSPTMPKVSPAATCTVTPSTARIHPCPLPSSGFPLIGKYFLSPIPCRIMASSDVNGLRHPAVRHMAVLDHDGGRVGLRTDRLALQATGGKGAARWEAR